jgi:hypothetical protein
MLKWTRKNENESAPPISSAVSPVRNIPSQESLQTVPRLQSVESFGSDVTHIGKSIVIKGTPEVGMSIGTANLKAVSSYSTGALLSGLTDVSAPTCKPVA